MSRGGKWKTDAVVSILGNTQKRGRWATPKEKGDEYKSILEYIEKQAAKEHESLDEWADWARRRVVEEAGPKPAHKLTIDLSRFDLDEAAALALLIQRMLMDGPQNDGEYLRDVELGVRDTLELTWAMAEQRFRVQSCFHKLLDTMVDLITIGSQTGSERLEKGADAMANTLARLVHRIQKRLEKRPVEKGRDETEVQLWESELFQKKLNAVRSHKASAHPKRRFVEYLCISELSYPQFNQKMNGRELVIEGIVWKWPKTADDFDSMRKILQAVSVENLDLYADILEEDKQTGKAAKIRALATDEERSRFYHAEQIDEAFRSHFGLSKPRAKKATKRGKPQKRKARKLG